MIHLHKKLNFNLLLVKTRHFCTYLIGPIFLAGLKIDSGSWHPLKKDLFSQACFTQDCVSQSTCWERAMEEKVWGPCHCAFTDDSSNGIFRLQKGQEVADTVFTVLLPNSSHFWDTDLFFHIYLFQMKFPTMPLRAALCETNTTAGYLTIARNLELWNSN